MKKKTKKNLAKFMSLQLAFSMTFASIFSFPINVHAETTYIGRITGNDVRFRSQPTTVTTNGVSNVITEVDMGTAVTVLSLSKVAGRKGDCESGWYNVSYQNRTGYICSTYISINGSDPYDRPWTSPKKAIVGGAKFIAGSYISRGQFTSYLKKFNVNPNGYYAVYNHLYMSNLAAPSSEAKTSWKTYNSNGLSSLPLSFNIPVFKNMADYYGRPGGDLDTVSKQSYVTDQAFEQALDAQGFPESYKQALRYLHNGHPNWTFTAMHTNLDFHTSVISFKNVGAIQGGNQYYDLSSGSKIQAGNDAGWYIPNNETTAYYLDPRNFLTENYILQFESLENSSNYTEAIVQGVLNNTFMSGYSFLDNQTYASIFVEAGRTANVSAVYLASLARQESGTTGGIATSGETFEYGGVVYSSLFNFFNIGAKSSDGSPVKAGLVYASGGACTVCGNVGESDIPLKLANYVMAAGYKVDGNYVTGINTGENADNVKQKMNNNEITINASNKTVGTGSTITFNGETYTVVIYGDLTGDGKINSADLLKMRQHLQGTTTLTGAYFKAGNLANTSSINSADLLKMRQHLLGTNPIKQS